MRAILFAIRSLRAALCLMSTLGCVVVGAATSGPTVESGTRAEVLSGVSAGALGRGRLLSARVEIFKRPHLLVVRSDDVVLKTYRVEMGPDPEWPKQRLGDGRTPEGEYYICEHRDATRYHRALLLAYPNDTDADRGFTDGLIDEEESTAIRRAIAARQCPPQDTALGGMILIHGQHPKETAFWEGTRNDAERYEFAGLRPGDRDPDAAFARADWTQGCIGLRNQDIRELFELLPDGTPVTIRRDP